MTYEEIKEVCETFGIDPKGAREFNEDCIISKTGDLICRGMNNDFVYAVWDNQLVNEPCWLVHLAAKRWYVERTFVPAFIEALCIQKKREVRTGIMQNGKELVLRPFDLRNDKNAQEELIAFLEEMREELSFYA